MMVLSAWSAMHFGGQLWVECISDRDPGTARPTRIAQDERTDDVATVERVSHGSPTIAEDLLAVEEPLEILLDGRNVSITMRTPGNDEELAAGFLFTEGIVRNRTDVAAISEVSANQVCVRLSDGGSVDLSRLTRNSYTSSSCGACGKTSIEALQTVGAPVLPYDTSIIDASLITQMPIELRTGQELFDRAGGLHAVAMFDAAGRMIKLREDVGRHNAVDKLIGAGFLEGVRR